MQFGQLKRREFITMLGGAVAWPIAARAQQGARIQRIGVLMGYPEGDRQAQANVTALRQGLENLGWIEGHNVRIDYRWAGADPDKARAFAKELVGLAPDVIVPSTNQVTRIVQQETRTIPVVFAFVGDPVGSGFVASLARPGRNITGFANFENSIGGKWLELLKEIAPAAKRAGFIFNPDAAPNVGFFHAAESAARHLAIGLAAIAVRDANDIKLDLSAAGTGNTASTTIPQIVQEVSQIYDDTSFKLRQGQLVELSSDDCVAPLGGAPYFELQYRYRR